MTIWTKNLSAGQSFTPTVAMAILYLAYQVSTDTGDSATITGSASGPVGSAYAGQASEAVSVPAGGGDVFVDAPNKPVSGMTITCVQGIVGLRIGY